MQIKIHYYIFPTKEGGEEEREVKTKEVGEERDVGKVESVGPLNESRSTIIINVSYIHVCVPVRITEYGR